MGPIHAQDQAFLHLGNNYYHHKDRWLAHLRCTDPRDDKVRIEDTKGGLLRDSYRWVLDNAEFQQWYDGEGSQLLWIKGGPGKGKTMLICGIIDELASLTKLAGRANAEQAPSLKPIDNTQSAALAYFFCQATDSRINKATSVLRGLIYLIVKQQPSLLSHIQEIYDDPDEALFSDPNAWVALSNMFDILLPKLRQQVTYIIVDALDECIKDLPRLLDFIIKTLKFPNVKWIVSSRNVTDIERKLTQGWSQPWLSLEIKENAEQVSLAVRSYIRHGVSELLNLNDEKLKARIGDAMQRKAEGTFLWASLVIEELKRAESWEVEQILEKLPSDLEDLYNRMLDQIRWLGRERQSLCLLLLSAATTAYRPLHLSELGIVAELPEQISDKPESVATIVSLCGSFLTIREEYVFIVHQSAKDFLLGRESQVFPHNIQQVHQSMFSRSILTLSHTLRRDIYGLNHPGFPIDEVKQPNPDPLAKVRYSCIYWVDHLQDSGPIWNADNSQAVNIFLRSSYFHWLEALSLLRSTSVGILSMLKLECLLQVRHTYPIVKSH